MDMVDMEVRRRPSSLLETFNELLTRPLAGLDRARGGGDASPLRLLAGSVVCYAFYGAAAGFFQGGDQILVAALKTPLIILFSLLLCVPSLYVFSAVSGANWTPKAFFAVLAGFAGTLALILLALLPINWLFSASSRYVSSAVLLHFALWLLALGLAWRFLRQALGAVGSRSAMFLWLAVFCLVSLQATTLLRPVLERKPGTPLFVSGKKSFMEHFGDVLD
ncbi:MAG TPA: hypothetical protein VKK31_21135 [Thermoanaerobaculia bacterium]|nr:hypothetical protein [Thermoanaerobaculia bacterium]